MNYVVDKNTGRFITCFVNVNNYTLKENEVVVTTKWVDGLYEPTYNFKNNCWINGISQEQLKNIEQQNKKQQYRLLREVFFNKISDKQSKWQNVLHKQPKEQRDELEQQYYDWYEKWLEIPLTMQVPITPVWLQPLFHKEVESRTEYQDILKQIQGE